MGGGSLYIPACMHTFTYVHTHIPTYLPTYLPTCLPADMHTYIHTPTHTYIHTYINTYTYTYTRTDTIKHYLHACIYAFLTEKSIGASRISPFVAFFNGCPSLMPYDS